MVEKEYLKTDNWDGIDSDDPNKFNEWLRNLPNSYVKFILEYQDKEKRQELALKLKNGYHLEVHYRLWDEDPSDDNEIINGEHIEGFPYEQSTYLVKD